VLSEGSSGTGGGALRLLCKGEIVISAGGQVNAAGVDGTFGTGGGGGGLLVLGSETSVTMSGTVDVSGGDGGPAASSFSILATAGPGGGGAGGVLTIVAPSISIDGTTNVAGGASGSPVPPGLFYDSRSGGGAGGAGLLNGGNGGSIFFGDTILSGDAGNDGDVFEILGDPRAVIVN
jgi:hypothetical protein